MYNKLEDMDFKDKKVIMRADYNVPIKDGKITDDSRIQKTLPTIKYLLENNASQIILMSHLGKPKGEIKKDLSLEPVSKRIREIVNEKVYFEQGLIREIDKLPEAKIIVLENTRFDPGEKQNDPLYAQNMASFADIFVLDAFGASHRKHASVTGIMQHLPACAGKLMQKELEIIGKVVKNPKKPFIAIIGGAKADKIDVIKNLLPKVDSLIIGGILANTFLKAKGVDIKGSKYDQDTLDVADEIIEVGGSKILLPEDVIAAGSFLKDAEYKTVSLDEIPQDWLILDIGPETIAKYKEQLKDSNTITWGGPIGVFEWENFSRGTKEIAEFIAESDAVSVICGGDSGAAVNRYGLEDKMTHVSTGGGASLHMLSGKKLPGQKALEENYEKYRE
ncbi:phosphoglycerate kinase [Candidatus Woesearchaeota archaeon]|nr:phosphoglycerate kinase [Candidatus Woesearchaeota archaeon]